ncbi:MAG: DUF3501 family protein [Bdellovibrio sp.]|nr:DUF3501 family protein [Bdellovibrio sp.]
MRKLQRFDIMDYLLYEEKREELRRNIMKIKRPRRIFIKDKLLFLFENTEMVRDHVLETIRLEKLFSEHDLLRQLDVFNPLIGEHGELRCTMIVLNSLDWERPKRMKMWKELASHIYLVLDDGQKVYAQIPEIPAINRHPCSIRVLKFVCGSHYPVKIGSDFSDLKVEEKLSVAQQKALREDLAASSNILEPALH